MRQRPRRVTSSPNCVRFAAARAPWPCCACLVVILKLEYMAHAAHDSGPAPRTRSGMPGPDDPLWYKDAILYELHVKAFFDSNDDGIGDFRGLMEKLDYLQD